MGAVRWLLAIALAGCATTQTPRPQVVFRAPSWPDFAVSIEAIRCAITRVDGSKLAERVLDVRILAVDNYHLAGCYDADSGPDDGCAGPMPPPTVYVRTGDRIAWHSSLRYELLCRRRLHLVEGDERKCTAARWEGEIKARYNPALRECRLGLAGTRLAVMP